MTRTRNDKRGRVEHAPGVVTEYLSSRGPLGFVAGYYWTTKADGRSHGPHDTRRKAAEAALKARGADAH